MGSLTIFYLLAAGVILCSTMVISLKNAVTSAVFLIADLFLLAAIYAQLGADFMAGIQVLVYAGAILVLFLFVIMLLNLDYGSLQQREKIGTFEKVFCGFFMVGVLGLIEVISREPAFFTPLMPPSPALTGDNTYDLGMHLFSKFLWPFELASLLILLAIIASIVIAKKKPQV
jgi:NADH-quinone oxidoreductase subunit J